MNDPITELTGLDLGDATVERVLRATAKSLLADGRCDGRRVVVKVLRTDERLWRDRFAHEIRIHRALAEHPAPVPTPALVHTDGARVLVIEHLPGRPVGTERYPTRALTDRELTTVLDAVTAFAGWSPPPGTLTPVLDHPDRVEHYRRAGLFDDRDRDVLHRLLARTSAPDRPAHGDPLPSNLLLDGDGCALVDFEFTGHYLPGFDLAMLHTLLAETPGAQERIERAVGDAGVEIPFLINRAMVVSRELRMHRELDDGPLRRARLALLEPQWAAVRARLRTLG